MPQPMRMLDRPSNSGLFAAMRLLVGIGGAVLLAMGVLLLAIGVPIVPMIVIGAVGVVSALWERTRYRSESAEGRSAPPGPGGGEPDAVLEPRFARTGEVFVDPTSGRTMRVYVDAATGERRYRAEP
jgi:hypothetical protein